MTRSRVREPLVDRRHPQRQLALARHRSGRPPRRFRIGALLRPAAVLLDLALVAVLAVGLSGRAIRPDTWWWPQAAALVLPLAALPAIPVGIGLAVMAWRRTGRPAQRAWVAAGVHLALAAVALNRLGMPGVGADAMPASAPPGTLRVLALNAGGPTPWSSVLLTEVLGETSPHLVALQETHLVAVGTDGAEAQTVWAHVPVVAPLLDSTVYAVAPPRPGQPRSTIEMPVFGRIRVQSQQSQLLGTDEDAGQFSRTVVRWDGRDVAVYNVHLRSFGINRPWTDGQVLSMSAWIRAAGGFQGDFVLRAAEADRFRDILDAERLPFLLVGDLNTTPGQWAHARIGAGLTDALGETGRSATYPDRRPLFEIDAVFASPGWTVVSAAVARPGLSDHRAIVADLRLE